MFNLWCGVLDYLNWNLQCQRIEIFFVVGFVGFVGSFVIFVVFGIGVVLFCVFVDWMLKEFEDFGYYDFLIGLLNWCVLLEMICMLSKLDVLELVGIVVFDVMQFCKVNDCYGDQGGDGVLCFVVQDLNCFVEINDFVCWIGGSEFVLLWLVLECLGWFEWFVKKIFYMFCCECEVGQMVIVLEVNVGFYLYFVNELVIDYILMDVILVLWIVK